jgi:hypothetical protein
MNAEQKIKFAILERVIQTGDYDPQESVNEDSVDRLWSDANDGSCDMIWEATDEFRSGEVETGVECEWSRHYEAKSVAAKMSDGSWVGWTYWYGGGKHGSPESIDWVDTAYDLDCAEEEKLVTVRTFTKQPPTHPSP